MGCEIIDARTPRISGCPVSAPALPSSAVEIVGRQRANSLPVRSTQWRVEINHIDLGVRIAGLDTHVDCHFIDIVTVGNGVLVKNDSKDFVFSDEFEMVAAVSEPFHIFGWEHELPATPQPFGLIERKRHEAFHARLAKVDVLVGRNSLGLGSLFFFV